MFQAQTPLMVDAVEACVRPVAPGARLRRLHEPPVVGAALMAIELAGPLAAAGARASLSSGFAARV